MGLFHGSPRKVINFVLAYRLRHPRTKEATKEARWSGATIADRHTDPNLLMIVFPCVATHDFVVKEIFSDGKETYLLTNVINPAID